MIDGVLVLNDWYEKGTGTGTTNAISFVANVPKAITLFWYENGGGAKVNLSWNQSGSFATVPASRFTYGDNVLPDTYTVTLRVTDAAGDVETQTMTIRVNPAVTVSGASTLTTTYSRETTTTYVATGGTTSATGGTGGFVYSIASITRTTNTSGDTSSITIDSVTGVLSITGNTQHDTYTITIQARDSFSVEGSTVCSGCFGSTTLTLRVNESVSVSGATTFNTTEGRSRSTQFTASLGTGPYTYQILQTSDSLSVSGITISSSGLVTVDSSFVVNQPSDTFISYAMTVIVTDARGDTTTARITIYINDTVTLAGDSYLVTTLTKAISSSAYSAARGTPGYTFSLASVTRSRLTSGDTSTISIGSTSGIVTANVSASTGYDTYTVVVRVTDVAGDTEQVTLTILVNDTISFTSAATSISTTYSRETSTTYLAIGGTTASTGGSGSITYSLSSITRSTNTTGDTSTISIDPSSGLLTILATTQHDTYTVRIRATDSLGMYREVTLTLRVNESVAVSGAASIITTEGRETTTTFTASL
ncbi:MAG: cadherin repeat domain-containing protein, partial [Actinobacteria bacterium]|nr:cadherin repeat domain-containing protein [Actinomycetota bacterium]